MTYIISTTDIESKAPKGAFRPEQLEQLSNFLSKYASTHTPLNPLDSHVGLWHCELNGTTYSVAVSFFREEFGLSIENTYYPTGERLNLGALDLSAIPIDVA